MHRLDDHSDFRLRSDDQHIVCCDGRAAVVHYDFVVVGVLNVRVASARSTRKAYLCVCVRACVQRKIQML